MNYIHLNISLLITCSILFNCSSISDRDIETSDHSQYILVIRKTKIYSKPLEVSKYEIGNCNEGTVLNVEKNYYNKSQNIEDSNIAKIYYKVSCNNSEGFLPDMRKIVNIVADENKENFPKNWTILRDLSIFDEKFNGTFRNKENKVIVNLSGNLYGGFTNKKIARARLTVYRMIDKKDTTKEELGQITKIASNLVIIQFKNTNITLTKINQDQINIIDSTGYFLGESNKKLNFQSSNVKLGYDG
ncbi:hypothetical protein [Leptospira harrisiae]|uniref:hypothetical protein n=1 Tax=Leptospira harrisiae TaxID=2023189 RepID=UPI000C2B33BE|nr:hypothetical protein [Leptospira harrisiae]PKA06498.1 hypothetical protein CH366_18820 [Leptospira harrisiae]